MLAGLAGEAGPYRRLLDELSGLLRAYYGRRAPPGIDVEDLVQETLIAVHTRRATYDARQPFTAIPSAGLKNWPPALLTRRSSRP